jgi:hypothetical protein
MGRVLGVFSSPPGPGRKRHWQLLSFRFCPLTRIARSETLLVTRGSAIPGETKRQFRTGGSAPGSGGTVPKHPLRGAGALAMQ